MRIKFTKISSQTPDLNRVQESIISSLNSIPTLQMGATVVTTNNYAVQPDDGFIFINTNSIPLIGSPLSARILLPDAKKVSGYFCLFQKTDSSSNAIAIFPTIANQTVQGGSSYTNSAAYASGMIYSDQQNWWVK